MAACTRDEYNIKALPIPIKASANILPSIPKLNLPVVTNSPKLSPIPTNVSCKPVDKILLTVVVTSPNPVKLPFNFKIAALIASKAVTLPAANTCANCNCISLFLTSSCCNATLFLCNFNSALN